MKTGLMMNIDINTVVESFLRRVTQKEVVTEEDLYPFIDIYADTQITDVLLCTFCQFSLTPSKVISDTEYKFNQKIENGQPVDYAAHYEPMHIMLNQWHLNPVEVWVRRIRQRGMRAWFSVRMNDCHFWNESTSFLRSDFLYEAIEKGWMTGLYANGKHKPFLNYAVPEVRQRMLRYLEEQLNVWDIDGLELDFQREIYCFDYETCPNPCQIIGEFVASVKALVRKAEVRVGHTIELAVRTCPSPEHSRIYGFDGETLVKAGVDRIIVSPHFLSTDSDMPLQEWKQALPGTAITAGLELLVNRLKMDDRPTNANNRILTIATPAMMRGYGAHYLAEGSDGIYLFNHFVDPTDPLSPLETKREIFTTCGSLDTAATLPQMQVMTYPDTVPYSTEPHPVFPVTVGEQAFTHTFRCGIVPTSKVDIIFGVNDEADAEKLHLTVNGVCITHPVKGGEGEVFTPDGTMLYTASVPAEAWADKSDMTLLFTAETPAVLTYLAIANF